MSNHAFIITVSASTLADTIKAFGLLHKKVKGGAHLHLYKLRAIHGGAFAAAWAVCNVDLSVVAAAARVACNARELAEMTMPDDCAKRCTGRIEMLSSEGNYFSNNGVMVKRRFGSKRDVIETLVCTTTLPSLSKYLMMPCSQGRISATAQPPEQIALHVGPTTEWDVCPSRPSDAVACFSELPDFPVEEAIGLFYLSQADS